MSHQTGNLWWDVFKFGGTLTGNAEPSLF